MSDWLSYDLVHLIPFGKDVYFRLIARLNEAVFPQQFALAGIGIIVALGARKQNAAAAFYLAPLWVTTALIFFPGGYSELHWAGKYASYLFMAQAPLLVWLGWHAGRTKKRIAPSQATVAAGRLLVPAALLLWPLAGALAGGQFALAEVVGVHADPTAILTLGTACLIFHGRTLALALIIPVIWLLLSGLTHIALASGFGAALFIVATTAVVMPCLRRRSDAR